jgi:hypothetical protein
MANNILDELLAEQGLTFEKLTAEQREEYLQRLEILEAPEFTVDNFKNYIYAQKSEVEKELSDTDEFEYFFFGLLKRPNRKHLMLKARLKNYLFLELFFKTPDQRKKQIEAEIKMGRKLFSRRKSGLL